MMFLISIIIWTLLVGFCQNLMINTFRKDLLCDLTERISKGCSREVATDLNLIQCVTLCGRNDSCIGASLDGNGKCFLHQECHNVRFCITEDTSHHYMSKYCKTSKDHTQFCTKCIHRSCYARTCAELVERGYTSDGHQTVDPDGPGETSLGPEVVYCDMTSRDGVGVTVIGHDMLERTLVDGYEAPQSYRAEPTYNLSFQQAVFLADNSQNCRQYISWECRDSLMYNKYIPLRYTGWLNRSMLMADYFGEGTPGTYQCTCGKTRTCNHPDLPCNCDRNDGTWRKDDGYLTVKYDLPIYAFVAGETGGSGERGYHTLGELSCWGTV